MMRCNCVVSFEEIQIELYSVMTMTQVQLKLVEYSEQCSKLVEYSEQNWLKQPTKHESRVQMLKHYLYSGLA